MKHARLAALALAAAAAAAVPASANHSWGTYHWATTDKVVKVKMNAAITAQWEPYVDRAISIDWESPVGPWADHLTLGTRINLAVSRKKCTPIAGQILVCNDLYGQRGWLGIASIWADAQGHITQATTKLNDTYFSQARYNTEAWRRMVTCQEIGHDFGLAHQDEGFTNLNLGSCMDYTNDPSGNAGGVNGSLSNEDSNAHDFEQLHTIYNHTDGYTTAVSPSTTNFGIREFGKPQPQAAAPDDSGETPAEWGRAVRSDGLGRPDVFVQDLPGGRRKITHVFWALETKRSEIHHD
jgi:hypothetical protein